MDRFDLGTHKKRISTSSDEAQRWFNIGLNWCFGFNQEEGAKCFQRALEHDPECVMAHWGVAYAIGPFYNNVWRQFSRAEADNTTQLACLHIAHARRFAGSASALENDLVDALAKRFQQPHAVSGEEFDLWDDDYANAMRSVYAAYPDDHDVAALFAEAMMTRTAWQLWDVTRGVPAPGSDVLEALDVIERSIAANDAVNAPQHPAILHLHIHSTEMSNEPERAMRSADTLGTLCPDAGHMNHMPGHTYVLCGEYEKAKIASEKAICADNNYVEYAGAFNFYTTARCHDLHLMMYTCMFLGQFKPAMAAAEQMCATLSKEVLSVKDRPQMAITMEGYYSMKMHVLVRFGRWQDIIDAPMPDDPVLYCVSTAMHHYAKGVAFAALKNFEAAEAERIRFDEAVKAIPKDRKFFNNSAHSTLAVGEMMLHGELEYHKGNHDLAFEHLRESVRRDDCLEYTEPWAWMHPPRHALAALLAEQGHFDEAEDVYRTDLGLNGKLQRCAQHPRNVWALHGLVECLRQRGESEEIVDLEEQLRIALTKTDVPVTSSCLCRTTTEPNCCGA
ncbi:MAG: tetratricopeptide repeat protein [Planktotalea sp.]|uniref:tetratricopeptide repeat protein n=1 Tax=Planktotalea sp. TaxID=2029877 RepID=UPI003C74ACBB